MTKKSFDIHRELVNLIYQKGGDVHGEETKKSSEEESWQEESRQEESGQEERSQKESCEEERHSQEEVSLRTSP
jgi:hypothetical protein